MAGVRLSFARGQLPTIQDIAYVKDIEGVTQEVPTSPERPATPDEVYEFFQEAAKVANTRCLTVGKDVQPTWEELAT